MISTQKSADFEVVAPNVAITKAIIAGVSLQDPVNIAPGFPHSENNGGVLLQLGNYSANPVVRGFEAEYTSAGVVPGSLGWAQIMRSTEQRVFFTHTPDPNGPTEFYLAKRGSNVLDTSFPIVTPIPNEYEDSPAVGFGPGGRDYIDSMTRSDSMTTFLFFKHNSPDSIYVPLYGIDWSWSGYALNDLGGWRLDSSSTTGPNVVNYPELPEWNGNYDSLPQTPE